MEARVYISVHGESVTFECTGVGDGVEELSVHAVAGPGRAPMSLASSHWQCPDHFSPAQEVPPTVCSFGWKCALITGTNPCVYL